MIIGYITKHTLFSRRWFSMTLIIGIVYNANKRSVSDVNKTMIEANGGKLTTTSTSTGTNTRANTSANTSANTRANTSASANGSTTTKANTSANTSASTNRSTTTSLAARKDDFHICHARKGYPYVCDGPKYDAFADKLEALLKGLVVPADMSSGNSTHTSGSPMGLTLKPSTWGRRHHSPFPTNTTILAVGNSHTRQILYALHCQYKTLRFLEPERSKMKKGNRVDKTRRSTYYLFEFLNHAKLHLVTNHAIFYSKHWLQYLEELVQLDLNKFDALVIGKMNTFQESSNTSFMKIMMKKTAQMKDADFVAISPPSLVHFAGLFHGPIVAHSMMSDWGKDQVNRQMIQMVHKLNRSNIEFVNGRHYVPLLGECGADVAHIVGHCENIPGAHRCHGLRGGHPDLVGWDIIEALNELL